MDGLERALGERLQVIRLNIDDTVGARARAVYGVQKVPTTILLNPAGSEVYRAEGKLPRVGQIREKLAAIETGQA